MIIHKVEVTVSSNSDASEIARHVREYIARGHSHRISSTPGNPDRLDVVTGPDGKLSLVTDQPRR